MLEAMRKIDYRPPAQVHLFPAPGPMLKMPEAQGALALTTFEAHPPFTDDPVIAQFVKTYGERAAAAGIPYTAVDLQSAIMYAAWQVLEAAVTATKSLDDKALGAWLKKNEVEDPVRHLAVERPAELRRGRRPVQGEAAAAGQVGRGRPAQCAAPAPGLKVAEG